MASNIKRPIQIFNGTDWDKILPEISEDMIKSGWTQSIAENGYKKLPGGLILQWGAWVATSGVKEGVNDMYNYTFTLPIAFNTHIQTFVSCQYASGAPIAVVVNKTNTNVKMAVNANVSNLWINFISIGY